MKLRLVPLLFAAAAGLFASCSNSEDKIEPDGPAIVNKLMTPKADLSVNMLLLRDGVQFEWQSAGDNVTYELAFDKAGGDFANPLAEFESEKNVILLGKEQITALFNANADEKGETAALSWAVYTNSSDGKLLSEESRNITFTTLAVPPEVESLKSPEDGKILNLELLKGKDVKFSWVNPAWIGDKEQISFELLIDEAEGDFSQPLIRKTSSEPQASVSATEFSDIYSAFSGAASEDQMDLVWTVYTKVGSLKTPAGQTRTLSLIPKEKVPPFQKGDDLYIGIQGSTEDGQQLSFISDSYYEKDNESWHDRLEDYGEKWDFEYYEVFTRLEKGQKYYIYAKNDKGKTVHYFKADSKGGFSEVKSENDALSAAGSEGIFRMRIRPDGDKIVNLRKVESIALRFAWGGYDTNNFTDAEMQYAGKGVWTIPGYNVKIKDMGGYKEDRYRFVIKFEGVDKLQGLSQNTVSTGSRPSETQDPSYWHVQLSYTGWDVRVFKYPASLCDDSRLDKWLADVNLYLNASKGHYTHEFVNPVENKAFGDGDPLYIDGPGTEAGQKMSYITKDSYNTGIGDSGEIDDFKSEDYRYEIFTRVEAGNKFYFRNNTSSEYFTLNEAGTEIRKISSPDEAEGTVKESGIYRIRFNVTTGKAYIVPVGEVSHFFCWRSELTPMTYEGRGVWAAKNMNIKLEKTSWGFDERYKFKFMIGGKEQPFGRMYNNGDRPSDSWDKSYWYVQPSIPSQWEPAFKYPSSLCDGNNLTRWYADLYLYMNDEHGHYTHEFTNAHE